MMRMRSQVSTQTLRNKVGEIRTQLTTATGPLTTCIEQILQSVQRTAATVGQVLECMSAVQAQTSKLHAEVKGALRQQAAMA